MLAIVWLVLNLFCFFFFFSDLLVCVVTLGLLGARPLCGLQLYRSHLLLSPALPLGRSAQPWRPARCLLSNQQNLLFQMNIDAHVVLIKQRSWRFSFRPCHQFSSGFFFDSLAHQLLPLVVELQSSGNMKASWGHKSSFHVFDLVVRTWSMSTSSHRIRLTAVARSVWFSCLWLRRLHI